MSTTNQPAATLETSLRRIEEIASALDREEMPIEKALELFQEGVESVRIARETLEEAELKVETLVNEITGPAN